MFLFLVGYQVLSLWLFLLSVVLTYFFVVQRLIFSLNKEVRQTRSLLLLIPADVLQDVPAIRTFLAKQYRRENRI